MTKKMIPLLVTLGLLTVWTAPTTLAVSPDYAQDVSRFSDPSPRIREQSAEFLSRIGGEEAVTALTQALQRETDADVRQRMAKLLGKALEKRE